MSFYRTISHRWFKSHANTYARPIIRIAGIGFSASIAVMLLACTITLGFQQSITRLMTVFNGHVRIESFASENPITIDHNLMDHISQINGVEQVAPYATLMGMIKTEDYNKAVVFKGYDSNGPWSFIKASLTQGRLPKEDALCETPEIVLSESTALSLGIRVGDKVRTFFFDNERIRPRAFITTGLFKTGVKDIDQNLLIGDIATVRQILQWPEHSSEGVEVHLNSRVTDVAIVRDLHRTLDSDLMARSTRHIYPELFDWLQLTDVNALIILILMAIVAAINIITIIAINLMEKSSRMAILLSLGASRAQLRRIMIYFVGRLCLRGMIWGNIVGLGIALLQDQTHLLKLNPDNYYLDYIPIAWNFQAILTVELAALAVCFVCMWSASWYIYNMRFTRAIHFDQ